MFDPPKPTLHPAEARVTEAHGMLPRGPLVPGVRVGDYVIIDPLDADSRHRGHRARHAQSGRIVALLTFDGAPPERF